MKKYIITAVTVLFTCMQANADIFSTDDLSYYARAGYSLGGTAPVRMPATIRKLSNYTLQPNFMIGADAYKPLGGKWGVMAGIHFDRKDMKVDARVKNYHIAIRRGAQSLEGIYTGQVVTDATLGEVTIPLQGTFDISSKVRMKFGPYVSYAYDKGFCGEAYDGYIRVGDPTGTKVSIGNEEGTMGTYDFSEDMRRWYVGLDLGADWYFSQRWGASLDISWGLNGVFNSSFDVLEDTLYPIYGSIGVIYRIK